MPQASAILAARRPRSFPSQEGEEDSWLGVTTLALWAMFLTVGLFGFVLPYWRPAPPRVEKPAPPVEAQLIEVKLAPKTILESDPAPPPPDQAAPPPMAEQTPPISAPPLTAVAEPSPMIAFALPVEGPVRVVESAQAAYSAPTTPAPVAPPAPAVPVPQTLVYGKGQGAQESPTYPPRAQREGQQGTVWVKFTVAEDGRVLSAELSKPSPWKLLNDEALRVITQRWHFGKGPAGRFYEIALRFQLNR